MKRLFVLALVAVFALTLIPAASAQDSGYVVYASGGWLVDCGLAGPLPPPDGGGVAEIVIDAYAPTGSMEEGTWGMTNAPWYIDPVTGEWVYVDWEADWWWPGFHVESVNWLVYVPDGGTAHEVRDLYAEGGGYIASIEFQASCPSGEIIIFNNSIYGVHMPDPAERVQAKVLFDVNVHSEPNPDLAIPGAVLLAGQDWFVVGSVVGTDGNLWYEVFVGGAHNGFVPAAAM
ncbi:MAG: hypothetical protein JXJ20_03320, partial [Anaerolineae bacterium]|nr:hypothetical protein [Anaerolineae bacterium]